MRLIRLFLLALLVASANVAAQPAPVLVIHGGAGATRAGMSEADEAAVRQALEAALRKGHAALAAGADGLVFYHWTDFLEDEAQGGHKRAVLREIASA